MVDETNAYVGYRSAGRRKPQHNDRRASADAPLAALRGFVSGVAGAPGDIESMVRMLPGLSEQTVLPTSEDVERRLPLRSVSETPLGRAVTGASQIGGGFYTGPGSPLRALAAVPGALRHGAGEFVRAAGQPAVNVIKPKGGNWLAGSAEKAASTMRSAGPAHRDEALLIGGDWARYADTPEGVAEMTKNEAVNRWLDTKLAKYIRNEMGTPEDPVRALAERGVTHAEMPPLSTFDEGLIGKRRTAAGFPAEGMAQSELARRYENAADVAIHNLPASARQGHLIDENPWLLKVPPETMTYGAYPMEVAHEMNFSHLADELRNAINPESGLPAHLLWKYGDLDKVTVPQAVQRVHDINEWRAAQKAEADLMRAQNAATFTHKEYPEAGFRWVELKNPESKLGEGETIKHLPEVDMWGIYDPQGGTISSGATEREAMGLLRREERQKALEDALKYEGETMGHCVGGYCPDVLEGRSRIYSLRDKKGQPHVTIEVRPTGDDPLAEVFRQLPREEQLAIRERALGPEAAPMDKFVLGLEADRNRALVRAQMLKERPELAELKPAEEIVQIKGKANRAPNAEYLPYVQDFVRSGQWDRVGDLQNTGLRDIDKTPALKDWLSSRGVEHGKYMTEQEYGRHESDMLAEKLGIDKPEGFATGGLVSGVTENVDPFRTDAAANPVNAHYFADGGQAGDAPGYAKGGEVDPERAAFGIYPRQRATPSSEATKAAAAKTLPGLAADFLIPQDAVDLGLMLVPGGKVARKAGAALIAGGAAGEAEAGGAGLAKRTVRSLGDLIDEYVRKVRHIDELGTPTYSVHKVEAPSSAEVPGWHITQDLPAVLRSGALNNRLAGGNMQGWDPAHMGGAYFYSDPRLAAMKHREVLEMVGADPAYAAEMPILRAQMRRGNRLAPDEDVGLNIPWEQSYREGSFATTRPVLLNQIDRIYSTDPGITKDVIRDTVIRQRRPGYAEGGEVEAAGSDPIPYDAAKIQGLVDSLREEMNG